MAIISNEHKFCFININRTGATTIRDLFKKQEIPVETTEPKITTLQHTIELFPNIVNYLKFSYVRCPYDWIISMYSDIIMHPTNRDYLFVKDLSLCGFIEWLYETGMRRKEGGTGQIYRTQTDFVFLNKKLAVENIYKFESLCNDTDTSNVYSLFTQLGLRMPTKIPVLRNSERGFGWEDAYDDKSYKLANIIFTDDFKNFNYKKHER